MEFYRCVVREEAAFDSAPLVGPREARARGKAADEDLVDAAGERLGVAARPQEVVRAAFTRTEVGIARNDRLLGVLDQVGDPSELIVARRVEVGHEDAAVEAEALRDPAKAASADLDHLLSRHLEAGRDEDRIGLPGQGGAQYAVVEVGQPAAQARTPDARPPGDCRRALHAAPLPEMLQ